MWSLIIITTYRYDIQHGRCEWICKTLTLLCRRGSRNFPGKKENQSRGVEENIRYDRTYGLRWWYSLLQYYTGIGAVIILRYNIVYPSVVVLCTSFTKQYDIMSLLYDDSGGDIVCSLSNNFPHGFRVRNYPR